MIKYIFLLFEYSLNYMKNIVYFLIDVICEYSYDLNEIDNN